MWVGLLTDTINNKLEKGNLINKHALNSEPVRMPYWGNTKQATPKWA